MSKLLKKSEKRRVSRKDEQKETQKKQNPEKHEHSEKREEEEFEVKENVKKCLTNLPKTGKVSPFPRGSERTLKTIQPKETQS